MPDPSNLDRAATVVHGYMWPDTEVHGHDEGDDFCRPVVEALATVGLLVTDEIQAVLDAAVAFAEWAARGEWIGTAADDLARTVDAYLATRDTA